jgi:4-hydroxy-tetrahydrodipicolinate reductase
MDNSLKLVVAGAKGRMGQVLLREIASNKDFTLTAALGSADDPLPAIATAQALIDFTTPAASVALAELAAQARIVHVIGTTGFSEGDEAKIRAAARHAVIVKSGNMSLGVALLSALAKQAAKALPGFDIEIVEMHHNRKIDAPSGTALLLGNAVSEGRNIPLEPRAPTGARQEGSIGFASLRGGTVIGEHDVIFAGPQERIVLSHIAEDRAIFAHGALAAARWGQGRKPGLYSMRDVLGI